MKILSYRESPDELIYTPDHMKRAIRIPVVSLSRFPDGTPALRFSIHKRVGGDGKACRRVPTEGAAFTVAEFWEEALPRITEACERRPELAVLRPTEWWRS